MKKKNQSEQELYSKEQQEIESSKQAIFEIKGSELNKRELIELSQYWAKICGVYSISGAPLASWFEIHAEETSDVGEKGSLLLKEVVAYTQASSCHEPEILFRSEFLLQNTDRNIGDVDMACLQDGMLHSCGTLRGALLDVWLFCDVLRKECPVLLPVMVIQDKLYKLKFFCYENNCWKGHFICKHKEQLTFVS